MEVNSMALIRRVRSPVAAGPRRICSERTCLRTINVGHPDTVETDNAPSEGDNLRIERREFKGHGDGDGDGGWDGKRMIG